MNSPAPSFQNVVRSRHSARGFLPTPISRSVLEEMFQEAQYAPSNCNTQPWNMHVVSGGKLQELSAILVEALRTEHYTLDFSFDKNDYPEPYKTRVAEQGGHYYRALGVARGDSLSRAEVVERNVRFFGAPHAAFLFLPTVGDNVRVASDVGMYAQTFLLSLAARGYAGVPQAVLGYFANTVRQVLGVPDDLKLLFGISFGMPDSTHAAFNYREDRILLEESVVGTNDRSHAQPLIQPPHGPPGTPHVPERSTTHTAMHRPTHSARRDGGEGGGAAAHRHAGRVPQGIRA